MYYLKFWTLTPILSSPQFAQIFTLQSALKEPSPIMRLLFDLQRLLYQNFEIRMSLGVIQVCGHPKYDQRWWLFLTYRRYDLAISSTSELMKRKHWHFSFYLCYKMSFVSRTTGTDGIGIEISANIDTSLTLADPFPLPLGTICIWNTSVTSLNPSTCSCV